MPNTFHLNLVTPERVLLSEDVLETNAPGTEGGLGILAMHAPLMTELIPGEVKVTHADARTVSHYVISGGFLEMSAAGEATILADRAERAAEIDPTHAQKELEAAQQMLASVSENDGDVAQAQAALMHAETRVRASQSNN